MKLVVTLMPPFPSSNGPVHLSVEHANVETWEVTERGVLALVLDEGREAHYNWAHVRSVEVDQFGSVAHGGSGLVVPR